MSLTSNVNASTSSTNTAPPQKTEDKTPAPVDSKKLKKQTADGKSLEKGHDKDDKYSHTKTDQKTGQKEPVKSSDWAFQPVSAETTSGNNSSNSTMKVGTSMTSKPDVPAYFASIFDAQANQPPVVSAPSKTMNGAPPGEGQNVGKNSGSGQYDEYATAQNKGLTARMTSSYAGNPAVQGNATAVEQANQLYADSHWSLDKLVGLRKAEQALAQAESEAKSKGK